MEYEYNKGNMQIEWTVNGITSYHGIRKHTVSHALMALVPDSDWSCSATGINTFSNGVQPTQDEIRSKIAELDKNDALMILRVDRNQKLKDCDWVVTKSNETGVGISTNWKTYRQALRDLAANSNPTLTNEGYLDYSSFTWPTEPT